MTIINANYQQNNYSPSNLNSIFPAGSEQTSKISPLYLGPGSTKMPGLTNVLYAPYDLYVGAVASYRAYQIGDREGIYDNILRIIQAPLCFGNAALQSIWYALYGGSLLKIFSSSTIASLLHLASPLSRTIAFLGFAISAIEGVLETMGLVRTLRFYKENYSFDLEKLKNSLTISNPQLRQVKFFSCLQSILKTPLPEDIQNEIRALLGNHSKDLSTAAGLVEKIEQSVYLTKLKNLNRTYFQVSEQKFNAIDSYTQHRLSSLSSDKQLERKQQIVQANLTCQKNELTRRVHPWLANRIESSLPQLIQGLESTDTTVRAAATERAASIFKNIEIQSQKKLLIHVIGTFAVLVTIAGLIAGCCGCPFMIPFIILLAGGVLSFTRYCMFRGLMDTEGWNFSISNCIPEIYKQLREQILDRTHETPLERPYVSLMTSYVIPHSQNDLLQKEYQRLLARLDFTIKASSGPSQKFLR